MSTRYKSQATYGFKTLASKAWWAMELVKMLPNCLEQTQLTQIGTVSLTRLKLRSSPTIWRSGHKSSANSLTRITTMKMIAYSTKAPAREYPSWSEAQMIVLCKSTRLKSQSISSIWTTGLTQDHFRLKSTMKKAQLEPDQFLNCELWVMLWVQLCSSIFARGRVAYQK